MSQPTEEDNQFNNRVKVAMQSEIDKLQRQCDELQAAVLELARVTRRLSSALAKRLGSND